MTQRLQIPGLHVFERGWLSANNILLTDDDSATLIDSGYVTHEAQTLALVQNALNGRVLDRLVNTHLHSDHCGGNHFLQSHYTQLETWIPPGEAKAVSIWDAEALSYEATGQLCPRFKFEGLLQYLPITGAMGHSVHYNNFNRIPILSPVLLQIFVGTSNQIIAALQLGFTNENTAVSIDRCTEFKSEDEVPGKALKGP